MIRARGHISYTHAHMQTRTHANKHSHSLLQMLDSNPWGPGQNLSFKSSQVILKGLGRRGPMRRKNPWRPTCSSATLVGGADAALLAWVGDPRTRPGWVRGQSHLTCPAQPHASSQFPSLVPVETLGKSPLNAMSAGVSFERLSLRRASDARSSGPSPTRRQSPQAASSGSGRGEGRSPFPSTPGVGGAAPTCRLRGNFQMETPSLLSPRGRTGQISFASA